MNKLLMSILATSTILGALAISTESQAMANYARQTGKACSSCHFQSFPALNEYGRDFKASGYTEIGKQGMIEKDGISLPNVLNAALVAKIRYQKSNGPEVAGTHNTNDGELQFPDEMLLMLGGRVSENIGAQVELNLAGGTVLENVKMPFIFDVGGINAGVIPFTTAGQGVSYGFELLNTGAVRGARIMEARKTFSAQQYVGTATAAEGIAVVASNSMFFANVSKWSPRSVGDDSGSPSANYLRLAVTPQLGDWDLGAGVQSWSGSATDPTLTDVDTKAWAVDAQAQGKAGNMPLGVYLTHANADGDAGNLFNTNPNDKTATTIAGQLGVLPGKATVILGYRQGDNGSATNNDDNAWVVGGTFNMVQNVQLQLNHEEYSGSAYDGTPANGDQLTTLMLFASF